MTRATADHSRSSNRQDGSDRNERIGSAIIEFLTALETGTADRQTLLREYSDVAQELAGYLDTIDFMNSVAPQLSESSELAEGVRSTDPGRGELGDFRILRELGRGGMGIVYEAEQVSLGRRVALKVLPLAATLNPQQLQRFRNEAKASASMRHPHIVGTYSVGVEKGVHYLAMELVEGRSLAQVIEVLKTIEAGDSPGRSVAASAETSPVMALSTFRESNHAEFCRRVARLLADAADALHYAHSQGIVHRDVKPANLLLDQQDHIWLTDFGLARLETDVGATLTGELIGTLRYMSPEQAAGKPGMVDFRTDIHALGATLYELIVLRPAFAGQDRAELLHRIAHETPIPLGRLDRQIPRSLETIVAKAMEKDREDRYESAAQLAADLRAFADDRPISARPPTLFQHGVRWVRRHSTAVAVALVVALLSMLGLAVGTAIVGIERNVAITKAEEARRNAALANANFDLALSALEETLAESVVGKLVIDKHNVKRRELAKRGLEVFEAAARTNRVDPRSWPTYRLLWCADSLYEANQLEQQKNRPPAETAYLEVMQEAEQLYKDDPRDLRVRVILISCLNDYSNFLADSDTAESDRLLARAESLAAAACEVAPDSAEVKYLLGVIQYNAGTRDSARGEPAQAEQRLRTALGHLDDAWRLEPSEVQYPYFCAQCAFNLAQRCTDTGQLQEAEEYWKRSAMAWEALVTMRPKVSEYLGRLGASHCGLARVYRSQERLDEGLHEARTAIRMVREAMQLEPVYEFCESFLNISYYEWMLACENKRDWQELATANEERVAQFDEIPQVHCEAALAFASCAEMVHLFAELSAEEKREQIEAFLQRALQTLADARQRFPETLPLRRAADAYLIMGDGFVRMNRSTDARAAYQSAHDVLVELRNSESSERHDELDNEIASVKTRLTQPVPYPKES